MLFHGTYLTVYFNNLNLSNNNDSGKITESLLLDSLTEYKDGYLDIPFSIENLSDFSKTGEVIQFRISVEEAEKRYNNRIGYRLQSRLKDEMR